jgi:hypothetical protein
MADRFGDSAMIRSDDLAQILRIEPRRKRGRVDEVAEHHRELPPLGIAPRFESYGRFDRRSRRIRCECGSAQCGDSIEQPATVADGSDAQLAQIIGGQPRQDRSVDVIVVKSRGVLFESQPAQPIGDLDRHCRGVLSSVVASPRAALSASVEY